MDWLKGQFSSLADTIVLLLALIGSITLVLHLAHHSMDQDLISWAKGLAQGFGAALLLRLNSNRKPEEPK